MVICYDVLARPGAGTQLQVKTWVAGKGGGGGVTDHHSVRIFLVVRPGAFWRD